jgi:hypothetical protein
MAKVKPNIILQGISGTIDKHLVFREMKDGTIILSAKPDFSRRVFSKDQLTHQSHFQEAAAYARYAAKTNPIYAELAKGTTKNAYNLAVSDWFNPPVIHSLKLQSDRILIEASDKVLVAQVTVTIVDAQGKILEQGQAVLMKSPWWEYVPKQTGRVIVEAFDPAGNKASQEMSLG